MASTPYRKGRDFEYRVRIELEQNGYFVTRSAGSKSPVDLVALAPAHILLVQCKRDGRLDPYEWNRLLALADKLTAFPILACSPKRRMEFRRLLRAKGTAGTSAMYEPFDFNAL